MTTMMEYRDKTFQSLRDRDSGRTISGFSFFNCHFQSCLTWCGFAELGQRTRMTNIEFRSCSHAGCSICGGIVEDVLVENFKTAKKFGTWGTVFKHVTLRGKIGRVMFSDLFELPFKGKTTTLQRTFEKANAEYYSKVDWALDIRQAEFDDFDCRGVPSRLVRRNPETQMMVTRERVLARQDAIGAGGEYWEGLIRLFLSREAVIYCNLDDAIYLVPRRPPEGFDRKSLIAGIEALRRAGVAEPD
ncbi:MAG: hypothetical protein POH28_16390 [Acidocella sp.]|nr:hypothetical protein [Acidocella sp.]